MSSDALFPFVSSTVVKDIKYSNFYSIQVDEANKLKSCFSFRMKANLLGIGIAKWGCTQMSYLEGCGKTQTLVADWDVSAHSIPGD